MALENHQELGTRSMHVTEGVGIYTGLTKPTGGEIVIGVELGPEYAPEPGRYVAVYAEPGQARQIAAVLNELAATVEDDDARTT